MKILNNLEEYKDKIILKDSYKEKNEKNEQKKGKKKTIVGSIKEEKKLSIIKEDDSFDEKMEMNEQKNDLEISMVGSDKLEKKKKNVSEIQNLIEKCDEEILNLNDIIKKYQFSSNDLIMKSGITGDISMVFINKKEEQDNEDSDDNEKKVEYFKKVKNEFGFLKKKLENLLSLYQLETELTEIKKDDLEQFENLKNEYNEIKRQHYKKI